MKQVELEQKLREMKQQKAKDLLPLNEMVADIKERKAAKCRVIQEIRGDVARLEQERVQLAKRMACIIYDWDERIGNFYNENYIGSRELEEISDWALARELNRRGFTGKLINDDRSADFIEVLNKKLNAHGDSQTEDE